MILILVFEAIFCWIKEILSKLIPKVIKIRHATSCDVILLLQIFIKFSYFVYLIESKFCIPIWSVLEDVFVNGDLKCVFRYNREHKGNFDNRDIKVTTFVLGKIKVETFEKQVKMNFRKAKNKIGLNENSIIKLFKKL